MIDFHCHLDLYPDPRAIAAECVLRGMEVLSVTTTPRAWDGTSALASNSPHVHTALGLHPQLVVERKNEVALFEELLPAARFVGEIGLDGSPEFRHSWQAQHEVFARVLDACERHGGRVLSVHSRRASRDVIEALSGRVRRSTAVLHWFSGSARDLARAIEAGCWFSVGLPMLTSARGRALVTAMPRERVLTETDGPFALRNGSATLPWEVSLAADALSALWGLSREEADVQLVSNIERLLTRA